LENKLVIEVAMNEMGFKSLSVENWLERDPTMEIFGRMSLTDCSIFTPTGEQRAEDFLQPQLGDHVPLEVRRLFEVARGALLYGYFFYPLYVLGSEQLFRVIETAVSEKCIAMKANRKIRNGKFEDKLAYLRQEDVIPEAEWIRWDATRKLRNLASHPESQTLYGPPDALRNLWITTEQIHLLFPVPQSEAMPIEDR
jgi:hypothetical protein